MKIVLFLCVLMGCCTTLFAESLCSGDGVPTGIRCDPSFPTINYCGPGATCQATTNNEGICCKQAQSANPVCSRQGYKYNGIKCDPRMTHNTCGIGATCEATSTGNGICCERHTPGMPSCSRSDIPTGDRCNPALPADDRCGPWARCQAISTGDGICCRPRPKSPLITEPCHGNSIMADDSCRPSLGPRLDECRHGSKCVQNTTGEDRGTCCRELVCSLKDFAPSGIICNPKYLDNVCGPRGKCEAVEDRLIKREGGGICCQQELPSCGQAGYFPTTVHCNPDVTPTMCGRDSFCRRLRAGEGICCKRSTTVFTTTKKPPTDGAGLKSGSRSISGDVRHLALLGFVFAMFANF